MKLSDLSGLIIPLVTLILGAGGLKFIRSMFSSVASLKRGTRARERDAFNDVADRAEWAEADRDFWRDDSGRQRYKLLANGIEPDPASPIPPSQRRGHR